MTSRGQAMVIRAQAENFMGYQFTSGRVHSAKVYGPYGFFNVKALVPKGLAIWPAIWMMNWEAYNVYGGWASCGELDIMETVCNNSAAYSTLHFGGFWPNNVQYPSFPSNQWKTTVDWTQPHWFGVWWTATQMTFYLDAQIVNGKITGGTILQQIPSSVWWSMNLNGQKYPGNAPFNVAVNFIINIAVGGTWPCSFDGCCSSATVPAIMEVYNVQAWNQTSSYFE
jgi:beta-glucanase (GH16 family)